MAPTQNGKTILLAEDEQPVRSFVLGMLQKAGYNVIIAVDGQDGLAKSKEFNGAIHLLLVTGHDLPPLHSHDILRCVRHIPL
jgi:DNA-binding response OmpR family regulator